MQVKVKTTSDVVSDVKAFKAKLDPFLQQKKENAALPLCAQNARMKCCVAMDIQEYIDLLTMLDQEFEDGFTDLVKLELCVTFISNHFMDVDISEISEQMGEVFTLSTVDLEMEIPSLQNDIYLKSQQPGDDFVDSKKKVSQYLHRSHETCYNVELKIFL